MFLFHIASRRKQRYWDLCQEILIAEIARKKINKGEVKQESISIYRGSSFKKKKINNNTTWEGNALQCL